MKKSFSLKYDGRPFCLDEEQLTGGTYAFADGVSVTMVQKEYPAYDAAEWVLYFENRSDKNSGVFSEISDCDTLLPLPMPERKTPGYAPREGDACVVTMNGMVEGWNYWENDRVSAREYNFHYEYLDKTPVKRFQNSGGRSSCGMMPFFDVTANHVGYIAAVGWTGDWKAEFTRCDDGIRMKTGLKETGFYLKPGEKLRTSSVVIMRYSEKEDKHNKFRRLLRSDFSHKHTSPAAREGLTAFELWGGLTSDEMKKRIGALASHGIRVEDIWIDAGWYGNCTKCDDPFTGDWSAYTGDWTVNPRVHPDGLREVSACAKQAGMRLMLWFEPERVVEGTPITKEHPQWFLTLPGTASRILNYGNPEAAEYVFRLLEGYVRELDLSCYRQDFNTDLTAYFRNADEEGRRGITEIKHITGMYALWDRLLAEFPQLIIDNCASGGRRIDIETLKRSIPFFRTDYLCNFNGNPEVLQTHQVNCAAYFPFIGCAIHTKRDTYAIRSSYSSSWGGAFWNAVFLHMDEEDFAWAKKYTDEYRSIRRYLSLDFYNHGSACFDDTSWAIWQYHDPDTKSGIVMAFRRSNSPFDRVTVALKGIKENGRCHYTDLDTGSEYAGGGVTEIVLPEKRSSTILMYREES